MLRNDISFPGMCWDYAAVMRNDLSFHGINETVQQKGL